MQVNIQNMQSINEDVVEYSVMFGGDTFLLKVFKDKYNNKDENKNFLKSIDYKYGDEIVLNGKIIIPEKLNNPYEFDYKKYLNSKGYVGSIATYSTKKIGENKKSFIFSLAYKIKEKIEMKIDNLLPQKEANLFKSMIYGNSKFLDNTIKENFRKDGISHLISVSGYNVFCIVYILSILLKNINEKLKKIIMIVVLLIFAIISLLSPSVLRAVIMASIIILFDSKKNTILKRLEISSYIILLLNPYNVFNISFLMSYTATLSITLFYNLIKSLFDVKIRKILKCGYDIKGRLKKTIYIFLSYINRILSFSFSVYILVIPIQLFFFSSFETRAIFSNLVITTIASFEQMIGIMYLFFCHVPIISNILINANYTLLNIIIYISNLLANVNLPTLEVPNLGSISILIYYSLVFIYRFRSNISNFLLKKNCKKLDKFIRKKMWICTSIYILYIITIYVYIIYFESYVYFFNVGQGNSCIIKSKKSVVVIDIGSTSNGVASNILNNFMKKKAICKIDLILLTHMHEDHMNGLKGVIESVKVDKVCYFPNQDKNTSEFNEVYEILRKEKISKIEIGEKETLSIADIFIYILSPPANFVIKDKDILNANSLVSLVSIKNKNFLFMGDATKNTENYIFNNSDTFKKVYDKLQNLEAIQVGHHGSNTSSSELLIKNINVKNAIISAKKEKFGHPNEEVLKRLKSNNIKIHITQKCGAIKFKINV
ncbi:MAG: ComEC/Rec2 family competence protein [Clostridia bacterium]